MMRNVRDFLRLTGISLMMAALAGCAGPLVEADLQQTLLVQSVTVDASAMKPITGWRNIDLTTARIQSDLQPMMVREMARPDRVIGQPVNVEVNVTVDKMHLVSRAQSLTIGGSSAMTGTMTVTEVGTGRLVLPPTEVGGISETIRLNGWLGAITAPKAEKDYLAVLAGFAKQTAKRLLGKPEKVKPEKKVAPEKKPKPATVPCTTAHCSP